MASDSMYLGGSSNFNESTGTYSNGYIAPKSLLGSAGSSVSGSLNVSKVSATPNIPTYVPSTSNSGIKPATPDLIQFNDSDIPIEFMTDLMFENIGGQEILSVSRNDLVNGQKVVYSPIKNLSQLSLVNGPQTMFLMPESTESQFKNFPIKLEEKVPEVGSNAAENQVLEIIYVDETTEDLIVNVINMLPSEQVELQVLNSGNELGDILY